MTILDRFRLDGKVAVVTGASSGLGVAFAIALAEAGADVAIGARRTDRLDETRRQVEQTGRRAFAHPLDVSDPDSCAAFADAAAQALGPVLHVLVNNAGLGTAVPASRETPEQFDRVIRVNLNGAYWMAQRVGRHMTEGGSIVNIGSILGEVTSGMPQAAYAASKAGLAGMTRDLAAQWTQRKGIRVNCVEPGFFPTEMSDEYPDGYLEQMLAMVPARRAGALEECAAAVLFLASEASSYVTGVSLPVDGGAIIA